MLYTQDLSTSTVTKAYSAPLIDVKSVNEA